MRRSDDFARTVRRGQRAGRPTMVVHYLAPPAESPSATPLVGFVVGRSVGNSVRRHHVARQLRHLVRDRLPLLPPGAHLVVRALAPAADRTSAALATDLDASLTRLLRTKPPVSAPPVSAPPVSAPPVSAQPMAQATAAQPPKGPRPHPARSPEPPAVSALPSAGSGRVTGSVEVAR